MSINTVIGPTPPGTGEIAPLKLRKDLTFTSPQSLLSLSLLIPTSMMMASFLKH